MVPLKDDDTGLEKKLTEDVGNLSDAIPHQRRSSENNPDVDRRGNDAEKEEADKLKLSNLDEKSAKKPGDIAPSLDEGTQGAVTKKVLGQNLLISGMLKFSGKKKVGIGSAMIFAVILLIAGVVGLGPLQLLHASEMSKAINLGPQEDMKKSRVGRVARAMVKSNLGEMRLGIVGSKVATNLEARFAENGITVKSNKAGNFDVISIDLASEGARNNPEFKDLIVTEDGKINTAKTEANFQKHFGNTGNVKANGNNIEIKADGKWYKRIANEKSLIRGLFGASDMGKFSTAVGARTLNRKLGITYHPIKNIDRKINDKIAGVYTNIKESLGSKIKSGSTTETFTTVEKEKPTDSKPVDAKDQTNVSEGANSILKGNFGKLAAGSVAVQGIICIAQALSNQIFEKNLTNIIEPEMRLGVTIWSIGDQMKARFAGLDSDMSWDAMGALISQMQSIENGTWSNTPPIQAAEGKPGKGREVPVEINPNVEVNPLTKILNATGANIICSPAAQAGGILIGALTGGVVSTAVGLATSAIAAPIVMEKVVNAATSDPPDFMSRELAGSPFGFAFMAGGALSANQMSLESAGAQMDATQQTKVLYNYQKEEQQNNKTRSIASKYLDPLQKDSAISKIIDKQNPNISYNIAKIPTTFFASFSKNITGFAYLFSGKTYAETEKKAVAYDYGLPYVGFTEDEQNDPKVQDVEANAIAAQGILKADGEDGPIHKYLKECNYLTIDDTTLQTTATSDKPALYQGVDGIFQGADAQVNELCHDQKGIDKSKLLQVRMAIYDTRTATELACIFDDEESCTELGIGADTSNEDCPPGTVSGTGEAGKIYWPLESGDKFAPNGGHDFANGGVPVGTPVHAITDGVVIKSEDLPGCDSNGHDGRNCKDGMKSYGRVITIDHGGKVGTINYAHFSKRMVEKGDKVVAGQVIGLSGEAGNASGPHLHIDSNPAETAIDLLKSLNAEIPPKSVTSGSGSCSPTAPGVYKDPLRDAKKDIVRERVDAGVDYRIKPKTKIYALGNAKVQVVKPKPNGWINESYLSYKLTDGSAAGFSVYFAEYCDPKVKVGQTINSDTVICEMNDDSPGGGTSGGEYSGQTETGWASDNGSSSLSSTTGCYVPNTEDVFGDNFNEFLKANNFITGVHTETKNNSSNCKLPAKYKAWK